LGNLSALPFWGIGGGSKTPCFKKIEKEIVMLEYVLEVNELTARPEDYRAKAVNAVSHTQSSLLKHPRRVTSASPSRCNSGGRAKSLSQA
jgi:hypothetical protein